MKSFTRITFSFAIAAALLGTAAPARSLVDAVNKSGSGVAIHGFDPVAYFTQSQPVKGSPQFSHTWMGATWQFASAGNRDRFAAAPEKYAPQFGGYCAYAVSVGHTANIDPEAWRILDNKLYLNYSKGVQKKWEKDTAKSIEDGNRNWPMLHK
jgi:YHS domain-containing protein